MGKHWEKGMCGIEKFVGFPAINFGRTLVVSFQLLPLVLGGRGCGRRKSIQDNWKEEEEMSNYHKG